MLFKIKSPKQSFINLAICVQNKTNQMTINKRILSEVDLKFLSKFLFRYLKYTKLRYANINKGCMSAKFFEEIDCSMKNSLNDMFVSLNVIAFL